MKILVSIVFWIQNMPMILFIKLLYQNTILRKNFAHFGFLRLILIHRRMIDYWKFDIRCLKKAIRISKSSKKFSYLTILMKQRYYLPFLSWSRFPKYNRVNNNITKKAYKIQLQKSQKRNKSRHKYIIIKFGI